MSMSRGGQTRSRGFNIPSLMAKYQTTSKTAPNEPFKTAKCRASSKKICSWSSSFRQTVWTKGVRPFVFIFNWDSDASPGEDDADAAFQVDVERFPPLFLGSAADADAASPKAMRGMSEEDSLHMKARTSTSLPPAELSVVAGRRNSVTDW